MISGNSSQELLSKKMVFDVDHRVHGVTPSHLGPASELECHVFLSTPPDYSDGCLNEERMFGILTFFPLYFLRLLFSHRGYFEQSTAVRARGKGCAWREWGTRMGKA